MWPAPGRLRSASDFRPTWLRALAALASVGVSLSPSANPKPTTVTTAAPLTVGQPVTAQITAEQYHSYTATLERGDHLVTVEQLGLDLIVEVGDPVRIAANTPTFRDDRETILLRVSAAGIYPIVVRCDEYTGATAQYVISISRLQDETAIEAYGRMTEAADIYLEDPGRFWERALQLYRDALALWQRAGDVSEQARVRYAIAQIVYWHVGDWREAAREAAAAASLYERAGILHLRDNALHLQAAALIEAAAEADTDTGASSQADDIYAQALALFDGVLRSQQAAGRDYDRAQTLNNIGLTHFYRSDWPQASRYFSRAADEFRRLQEWSGELNPLANLAVIDQESGQLIRAVSTYRRLLQIIPAEKEAAWRADTLDNLAAAQLALGSPDDALQHYLAALAIHDERDNAGGQARSLAGLGSTYLYLGELEQARGYFERALPLAEAMNDARSTAAILRSYAAVQRLLGNDDEATELYGEALQLDTTPAEAARLRIQRAGHNIDVGEHSAAMADLAEAQQVVASTGVSRISADMALQFGRLYAATGNTQLSEQWLDRAHKQYSSIAMHAGRAQSLLHLARVKRASDIPAAIGLYRAAIDQVEQIRRAVGEPELRAVYLGSRAGYYEELIAVQMAAYAASDGEPRDRYVRDAFNTAERSRARATVDLVNEAAVSFYGSVDARTLEQKRQLNEQLAELHFKRDRELAAGGDVTDIVAQIQTVETALDVLAAEIRRTHPRYAQFSEPAILTAEQVQEQLDGDTVLLQYSLGRDAGYVWAVTRESIDGIEIASRAVIDALTRRTYHGLKKPNPGIDDRRQRQAALAELARQVLAPVLASIDGKRRVVIAADGALQYFPFAVLSADGERRLLDDFAVSVVPSVTAVTTQRQHRDKATRPTSTVALIGDPIFSASDPRFSAAIDDRQRDQNAALAERSSRFSRLTFSGQEIREIAALVPASDRVVATGFDATKPFALNTDLDRYRFVHLATHGVIDSQQPALSTLVFSTVQRDGTPQDGFLRLADVYELNLNADLVVLSACDTALGREIRGEGLLGLTQGFMYAGATSIVASLWQVPDRATAALMVRFYELLLSDGDDPVSALRKAQLDLASERRWRDPYYWGGFVLQGDWRPTVR